MAEAPIGLSTLGRCLVAAGLASAVCSVALDERDLLRLGVLAMALPLFAVVLTQLRRRSVTATRTVVPSRVSVGSRAEAHLELTSEGLLGNRLTRRLAGRWRGGASLVLTDAVPDALGQSPRLTSALPRRHGETTGVRYPITPTVRGRHLIGPLTVRFGDPMGMACYDRDLAGRTALTVLPRVTPLRGLPGLGLGEGESGSTGLRRGPGERDAMVREYQPGDPLRTVHWRSTARRDELMVRLEERPWHGGVTVLLDRRTQAHRGLGAGSSLEWAIELVASVCHHLIMRGRRVTLIGEDGVVLASGRDPDGLLDTLALLRPTTQAGIISVPRDESELFAVLGGVEPDGVTPLTRDWVGGHAHAVLLDVAAWAHPGQHPTAGPGTAPAQRPAPPVTAPAQLLTEAGWTVLVATPDRPLDEVWREFCRRLAPRMRTGT